MNPALLTQIYALQAGKVLLLRRKKEPNQGLWVPPGGEVKPGESPYESALREFQKETGLCANKLPLRGMITFVSQESGVTSVNFLYACNDFTGEANKEAREGTFEWQHLHRVFNLSMPASNHQYLPHAINLNLPFYQARYVVDAEQQF